jgi:hypothetical protein
MASNRDVVGAIRASLSRDRMATYERAAGGAEQALRLYRWNAEVASALLTPLHVCEVVMRNAVSEALVAVYGELWPWSASFERSLPSQPTGYSPRRDLVRSRRSADSVGQVVTELKFVFWQRMFSSRHDGRVWRRQLRQVLPHASQDDVASLRGQIYAGLNQLRVLRNRIAHHEPVFHRNLPADLDVALTLVGFRCGVTAHWLNECQVVLRMIEQAPVIHGLPAA